MKRKPILFLILGWAMILPLIAFIRDRSTLYAAPQVSATPILLITDSTSSSKFGAYLGEVLRAEGLNYFDTKDLATVSASDLTSHDLTILAATTLSSGQAGMFNTYVTGGGRLLAIRPDSQIASLFGLNGSPTILNNGYLKIDPTKFVNLIQPGVGLSTATLQIHGGTDQYGLAAGAIVLAQLYSNASTATAYPAVVGDSTGHAIAFTYDLAQNLVYTRQGNPANANIDVDGDGTVRTNDLFQTVGQPNNPWVDLNNVPIPQADEQQRLFARAVRALLANVMPLPQLWYFPGTVKTMLILTADAHANPTSYFQTEITSLNAHGGKMTFFLGEGATPLSSDLITWMSQGHSFGVHPYQTITDSLPYVYNLTEGYTRADNWWTAQHGTLTRSNAVRNHRIAWEGWGDTAYTETLHNIAMDTNFYHYGVWLKNGATWAHGYITGSGLPMKFVQLDGTILPIYQQATQLVDEQLLVGIAPGIENLSGADATLVSQQLIDASLAGNYAALTAMFHVDYYGYTDSTYWAEHTMDYATSKGVPIWNADQWLSFTQARHDANLTNLSWSPYTLSFSANPTTTLTLMVPASYNGHSINSVSGGAITYTVQAINSVNMALFTAPAGSNVYTVVYNTPTAVQLSSFEASTSNASSWLTPALGFGFLLAVGSLSLAVWKRQRK